MLPAAMYRTYHSIIKGAYVRELQLLLLTLAVTALCFLAILVLPFGQVEFLAAASLAVSTGLMVVGLLVSRAIARIGDLQDSVAFAFLYGGQAPTSDFFMSGAAATPTLQLLLQKVLRLCRPTSILELGSGQTTRILARYCVETPGARLVTFEESAEWHERVSRALPSCEHHDYRHARVVPQRFSAAGRDVATHGYDIDPRSLQPGGYEFVVVDGPDGPVPLEKYARASVVAWLPQVLAPQFVVVFDDAERYGEASTVALFEVALKAHGIKAIRFAAYGVKTQEVFCSPNWAFLRSV